MSATFLAAVATRTADAECVADHTDALSLSADATRAVLARVEPQHRAAARAAMVRTCSDWQQVLAQPHEAALFWEVLALECYPRIEALASAIPMADYQQLYHAQLTAERLRAGMGQQMALSEYVFSIELYWKYVGQPEMICGSWTGFLDEMLECNLWQPNTGPAWSRQETFYRNLTLDWNALHLRILVTRPPTQVRHLATLILYDGTSSLDYVDDNDLDADFWQTRLLPEGNFDMTPYGAPFEKSALFLGACSWLASGRIRLMIEFVDNDLAWDVEEGGTLLMYLNRLAPWNFC